MDAAARQAHEDTKVDACPGRSTAATVAASTVFVLLEQRCQDALVTVVLLFGDRGFIVTDAHVGFWCDVLGGC